MQSHKAIRVIAVVLTAVLVFTVTVGSMCHHHDRASEATCQICHFGHQQIEPPLATHGAPVLELVTGHLSLLEPGITPNPLLRRTPARAPPSL